MKKLVITLVSIFVFLLVAVVGGAFLIGTFIEKGFRDLNFTDEGTQIGFESKSFERGVFSSSAQSKLTMAGQATDLPMSHKIYHGPLAFTPEGVKLGMTYVTTTLDRQAAGEDVKGMLDKVYGEKEPVLIHSQRTLTGSENTNIELTPVEYDDDEISVMFDGGSIESTSPGGSMEKSKFFGVGSGEFSALSIRSKSDEGNMRFRLAPSGFDFAYLPNGSIKMDGEFGKVAFKTDGINGEMEAVTFKSSYMSVAEGDALLLGSGEVTFPSFSLAMGEGGNVEIKDFKVSNTVKSASNNLIDYELQYEMSSLDEAFTEGTPFAAYSGLMKAGASVTMGMSVPREVANQLAELQQKFSAMQSDDEQDAEAAMEQLSEMMSSLDTILRKLTKGTSLGLALDMGDTENGAQLDLNLEYTDERPITSRKTIKELVDSMQVDLNAKIPKSIVESAPSLGEQLAPLVAMGTLTETAAGFEGKASLKDGALTTNGQPNPMLEQMGPMLEIPIDWDAMTSMGQ